MCSKNIECYIEKRNELTVGHRSRNFNVGIRTWFDAKDTVCLRMLIVDLFLDLSAKLEILETKKSAVARSDQK